MPALQETKEEVVAEEAGGEADGVKVQADDAKVEEDAKPDQPEAVTAADGVTYRCVNLCTKLIRLQCGGCFKVLQACLYERPFCPKSLALQGVFVGLFSNSQVLCVSKSRSSHLYMGAVRLGIKPEVRDEALEAEFVPFFPD